MSSFQFPRAFLWAIAFSILSVCAVGCLFATHLGLHAVAQEGGPLETTQLVLLAFSTGLFTWAGLNMGGTARMAAVFAGVASITLFLREFDPEVSGPLTAYVTSHSFRLHQAIATALPLFAYCVSRPVSLVEIVRWASKGGFWPVLPIGALLGIGAWFDGQFLMDGVPYLPVLVEELAETSAYAICLLVALHVAFGHRWARTTPAQSPASASSC